MCLHHEEYYHSNAPPIRAVYRALYLSFDELEYLSSVYKSTNRVITLTAFGSASLTPEVALSFGYPGVDRIACLFEIIITDENDAVRKHTFRRSPKYPTRTKYYSPWDLTFAWNMSNIQRNMMVIRGIRHIAIGRC